MLVHFNIGQSGFVTHASMHRACTAVVVSAWELRAGSWGGKDVVWIFTSAKP